MRFDATINITTVIALVTGIVTVVGAYYALRRESDSKFAQLTQSIEAKFAQLAIQLNTLIEGDVRELRGRIVKVESGQTEWTHTLRQRSHELADKLNNALLEIDRLKRPGQYGISEKVQ